LLENILGARALPSSDKKNKKKRRLRSVARLNRCGSGRPSRKHKCDGVLETAKDEPQ